MELPSLWSLNISGARCEEGGLEGVEVELR